MEADRLNHIFNSIFNGKEYEASRASGGASVDLKYVISCEGKKYFVKLIRRDESRLQYYEGLCRIREAEPQLLVPESCTYTDGYVVIVTRWMEGRTLDGYLLEHRSEMEGCGEKAGRILFQMHNDPFIGESLERLHYSARSSVDKRIREVTDDVSSLGICFDGAEDAVRYLNDNIGIVRDERRALIHNDVRPENFFLSEEGMFLYDFEDGTISDRYQDFSFLTTLSAEELRPFSRGFIRAYFDGNIPDDFWQANLFFSTLKVVEYAVFRMKTKGRQIHQQSENLLTMYDHFRSAVPDWWEQG